MTANAEALEFWRGDKRCKCGWLLPRKSAIHEEISCDASSTTKHTSVLIMYCPECGTPFTSHETEMDFLVTN